MTDAAHAPSGGRDPARQAPARRFWLIEPAASFLDSRWQDRAIWRVVVAAPAASLAVRAAEAWARPEGDVQIGNESDSPLAGFGDEKLYFVRQVAPEPVWLERAGDGEAGVVDAELLRPAPRIIEI